MLPKPPLWSHRWETRDLDELRTFIGRWGDHRRQCLGRGAFDFRLAMIGFRGGAVGWCEASQGQKVRATTRHPLLHLAVTTPITYRVGHRHFEAAPGSAVFIPAGSEYEVFYGAGQLFAVQLDDEELNAASQPDSQYRGNARTTPVREVPVDPSKRAALSSILLAAGREPFSSHDRRALAFEQRLTVWTTGLLNQGTTKTTHGIAAASRLQRVEEWIDAHIDDSISVAQLCGIAGIEFRGLQASFRRRRGVTPTQWIRARRLAAARVRLLDPRPGDTVTEIAFASGLMHPGRFATAYRRRYGEPPSETLRRRQPQ